MGIFLVQLESWEAFPLGWHNNFKFKLKDHSVRAFLARVQTQKTGCFEASFYRRILQFNTILFGQIMDYMNTHTFSFSLGLVRQLYPFQKDYNITSVFP